MISPFLFISPPHRFYATMEQRRLASPNRGFHTPSTTYPTGANGHHARMIVGAEKVKSLNRFDLMIQSCFQLSIPIISRSSLDNPPYSERLPTVYRSLQGVLLQVWLVICYKARDNIDPRSPETS